MMIPWFYVKLNLRWNEDDIFKIYFIPGIFSPPLNSCRFSEFNFFLPVVEVKLIFQIYAF